ncbi:MAG: hypothetical protein QM523_00495 [Candidatus Pacebacteria bacterium]|nr:hypothetical protein [Candidatus Paceibacterota bacterium]
MNFDFKSIIATVAPGLATALGGPLAGVAASVIGKALFDKPGATVDDVATAIAGATPETLEKLKQVEADFKIKMAEVGVNLETIAAGDRKDARAREILTKDWFPKWMAAGVTIIFAAFAFYIIVYGVNESSRDISNIILGVFGSTWTSIMSYYFGSSSGSAEKTRLLGQSNNGGNR